LPRLVETIAFTTTPSFGIAVFGLSFVSLFSGTLIAKDRATSFLTRLFASPLTGSDFILGYTLPVLPTAILQSAITFGAAFFLGLAVDVNVLVALVVLIPAAVLFVAIGLLAGTVFTDKQVGAVCGALLTNVAAWLSGTWFSLDLVGGAFKTVAYLLPFAHAVDATRAAIAGDYGAIFPTLWWVIGYAAATMVIAIIVFKRKMQSDAA
jgi:ABC-2 type transport system permease protein